MIRAKKNYYVTSLFKQNTKIKINNDANNKLAAVQHQNKHSVKSVDLIVDKTLNVSR